MNVSSILHSTTHPPACSICRACVRMLSHATADSAWLLKQLENGSSRHLAFEADRGKHAYLHSGLQDGLQAYPRQWASNREGGTSLYLSRQIVHNTVGSLPLAKNALHSLTSCTYYVFIYLSEVKNTSQETTRVSMTSFPDAPVYNFRSWIPWIPRLPTHANIPYKGALRFQVPRVVWAVSNRNCHLLLVGL